VGEFLLRDLQGIHGKAGGRHLPIRSGQGEREREGRGGRRGLAA
jgi:hypothetical protein